MLLLLAAFLDEAVETTFASQLRFDNFSGKYNVATIAKDVSCDEEEQTTSRKESLKKKSDL
eukprot:978554-Ditylum_brightwellii.AAC.1